jgi:hypothetical protein
MSTTMVVILIYHRHKPVDRIVILLYRFILMLLNAARLAMLVA